MLEVSESKETEAGSLDAATLAALAGKGGESNLRSLHQARTPGRTVFVFNRVLTGLRLHCTAL